MCFQCDATHSGCWQKADTEMVLAVTRGHSHALPMVLMYCVHVSRILLLRVQVGNHHQMMSYPSQKEG